MACVEIHEWVSAGFSGLCPGSAQGPGDERIKLTL